ncbi:PAS domain-containing sensor histidine kinase [Geomonas sp. Red69]|uniref:PAS domain-containing sensor histidine kinase n=1 Tax=Geomonas diazotrophica TaxID=2843197 RepID=A0ABX8JEJ8_9BACT|nr:MULTISPECIES: histidine kinase [Geomonas]MBU5637974.1 PAS domain-containing sensor histidine kinase [Geomonas diazotrophica]QWV96411.1 PAS domain-containing sensor histidine kinase [Geomonas nitrogeniifigens]QXE85476.1 PAS domain-containing sensor histidine kinase [Geomonas nitrogeniifigens]
MPATDPQLFETIVSTLSDGLYVVLDNLVVFLNQRFADLFGYYDTTETLIGRNLFTDLYPDPSSVDLFQQVHHQVLAGAPPRLAWGQPSARVDGTPTWIEVEIRRVEFSGKPALIGTFHDRTDCKLIGEAMHASQETLRMLLDAMEDRVYVVTDDYRIIYANRKMQNGLCGDIATDPCYKVCRGLSERCDDCSTDAVFTDNQQIHKEFFNEMTKRWYSVIELPIRMPGLSRPAKLAVARDVTEKKEHEKQIRALTHSLISAQEKERRYVSRELHDDLGQRLNAIKLGIDTLEEDLADAPEELTCRVKRISGMLRDSIQAVRGISGRLRPGSLERLGLVGAIEHDCAAMAPEYGLKIDFRPAGMTGVKLEPETEINLYRVFQEALHNVVKHAEATEVTVCLVASHPNIRMRIEDNGKGFDLKQRQRDRGERLGLVGMTERVDLLSGTFQVSSRPKVGTRIVVEVPYCQPEVN